MRTRTRLASFALAGAAAGGILVGTGAAQAAPAPGAGAQTVRPLGGCAGPVCGTVRNNTGGYIAVCKNWSGSGGDQSYPNHGCNKNQVAYVKPHSTYGAPEFVDLDAFYIAPGTSYTGYYTHWPSITHHNRTWRHVNSGWWKFATNVTVYINAKHTS